MYDTRWPRPGPALLAVGIVFGLVVGGILGISFPATSSDQPTATTTKAAAPRATAAPPPSFWTVVLASPLSLQEAQARTARYRSQGIAEARVLARTQYSSLRTPYAVCVGAFTTRAQAVQLEAQLEAKHPSLSLSPYPTRVRRGT
jgi:cell division septation protein DedD